MSKEPWLAVNLSQIFPGLGQIYSGKKLQGYFLIFIYIALYIIAIWLIVSAKGNIIIGFGLLVTLWFVWLWNLFDAHSAAKSNNTPEFEELRRQSKDPWLAMFLSQLFFGIGHFYIGKWLFGIFAVILIIVFSGISIFLSPIIDAVISYLAYVFSPVHRQRSKNWALIIAILIAMSGLLSIGTAFVTRTYLAEARWTPSGAMEPTLHGSPNQWEADKIVVDKLSYRFQDPERGDIIVFYPTEALQKEQYNDAFIKRIVGLPGEKVELQNGQVYINNKPLPENKYLSSNQKTVIDVCSSGIQPPYLAKPVTIPPASYLALGDNRNNSYDGRCWGVVPRELIIGKVSKRFFPVSRIGNVE
ncbi:signal peptidase I [Nostoc sp. TCL26-01]|nr:signal peptidase I [Nostoc sp. TCL26-01]